jgi:hypothetical protein
MELIIDFDNIDDNSKKTYLLSTLKLLGIKFKTSEGAQTLDEYDQDLERGNAEIEKGNYTTMEELLKEMEKW